MPQPEPTLGIRIVPIGILPKFVAADGSGSVLVQATDQRVFYGPDSTVTPLAGTNLGPGDQVILTAGQWFVCSGQTRLIVQDAQSTRVASGSTTVINNPSTTVIVDDTTDPVPIVNGDADYTPRQADRDSDILMAPATARTIFLRDENVSYCAPGNAFRPICEGPGSVNLAVDATVTAYPTANKSLDQGESFTLRYLGSNAWRVDGGHTIVPTATVPTSVTAGKISYDGTTVTVTDNGAWDAHGATVTSYSYQWRSDSVDISGETAKTYTKVSGDEGHSIDCVIKALSSNGTTSVGQATNAVAIPVTGVPAVTAGSATITLVGGGDASGGVEVGTVVQLNAPTYSGTPTAYTYHVFNVAADGSVADRGAQTVATDTATYTTQSGDTGETVYFTVLATNATGNSTTSQSAAISVVAAGTQSGGGGGGGGGTSTGSRTAFDWPFASSAPWNVPMGGGATFSTPTTLSGGTINTSAYTMAPALAASGDPLATVSDTGSGSSSQYRVPSNAVISNPIRVNADGTITPLGDSNLVVVDPTQTYVDETWVTTKNSNTSYSCKRHIRVKVDGTGTGFDGGIRAAGSSTMAGLIRQAEVVNGLIPHALALIIGYGDAKKGYVWPAIGEDSYASSYAGLIPIGSRMAIPASVNITTLGLTADGLVLAKALQDYGCYVVDTTAPGGSAHSAILAAEQSLDGNTKINNMKTAWSTLKGQLKLVTNATSASPGGPGTARASAAPAFGSTTPTGTPTSVTIEAHGVKDTGTGYAASQFMVWGYTFSDTTTDEALAICAWGGSGTLDSLILQDPSTSATVATGTRVGSTVTGNNGTNPARNIGMFRFQNPPAGTYNFKASFTTAAVDMAMSMLAVYPVNQTTPLGTPGTEAVAATKSSSSLSTTGGAATDLIVAAWSIRNTDLSTVTCGLGQTIQTKTLVGTNQMLVVSTQPGGTGTQTSTVDWVGNDNAAGMAVAVKLA